MGVKKEFLPYAEARKFVRSLGLRNFLAWKQYCSSGKRPYNIPSVPYKTYKNNGWISYMDWMGFKAKRNRSKRKFLPYLEAINIVRSLGIKNEREWYKYSKSQKLIYNIPCNPQKVYKGYGWVDWFDFLGTSTDMRKYKVADNYFKKWSTNMAWTLGFWFADGCIMKRSSYIFTITQHEKDKYILEAISKEMKSNYPLSCHRPLKKYPNRGNCCSFRICSKTIYNDVKRLGGKERKSLDVKFPHIPKKYLPDFVRGLWDGDGCITYNKRQKFYNSNYVSASECFIEQLHKILKENIDGLKGSLTWQKSGAYRLLFGRDDTMRLKRFMYPESTENTLFLKRKYELFKRAEEICNQPKRKFFSPQTLFVNLAGG